MKFISKNQNLGVILKSGMPANRLTGQEYIPSLSVKFQQGILIVPDDDEETLNLLKKHDGFNSDFICADEQPEPEKDPYAHQRAENEPDHNITEIQPGGIIGKSTSTPTKIKLTPVMAELIEKMATSMALKIAPKMAAELVEKLTPVADTSDTSETSEDEINESVKVANEENAVGDPTPSLATAGDVIPTLETEEAPKPKKASTKKKTTRKVSAKKINKVQEPEVIQTTENTGETVT